MMREPAELGTPSTQKRSLTATGTPRAARPPACRAPRRPPRGRRRGRRPPRARDRPRRPRPRRARRRGRARPAWPRSARAALRSRGPGLGTRKPPPAASGRLLERLLARQARAAARPRAARSRARRRARSARRPRGRARSSARRARGSPTAPRHRLHLVVREPSAAPAGPRAAPVRDRSSGPIVSGAHSIQICRDMRGKPRESQAGRGSAPGAGSRTEIAHAKAITPSTPSASGAPTLTVVSVVEARLLDDPVQHEQGGDARGQARQPERAEPVRAAPACAPEGREPRRARRWRAARRG